MKADVLIIGLLVCILCVLLFLAAAIVKVIDRVHKVLAFATELGNLGKEQTETQSKVIDAIRLMAELTGLLPVQERASEGWYEAIQRGAE